MECLPSDVMVDLLSRVPTESVLECKLVCKRWQTLICTGTHFYKMHLSRQLNHLDGGVSGVGNNDDMVVKLEPSLFFACGLNDVNGTVLLFDGGHLGDRICISMDENYSYKQNLKRIYHPPTDPDYIIDHLVGSCNGLICILIWHDLIADPIYICNPITREYVYLPRLNEGDNVDMSEPDGIIQREGRMYPLISCGFGYVRSTNEFKVVRIYYPSINHEGNVEVYTLGSGCGWRSKGKISFMLNTIGGGSYSNGDIYWHTFNKIVAFNLANEEFRLLPVPLCMLGRKYGDRCGLIELEGNLCLYTDKLRMEIWSFKKSSHLKESWCMDFDIDYEGVVGSRQWRFEPILLTKNEEIIFKYDNFVLYSYDTKMAILKRISDDDKASTDYFSAAKLIAHINIFISLRDIGEKSKRHMVGSSCEDDVIDQFQVRTKKKKEKVFPIMATKYVDKLQIRLPKEYTPWYLDQLIQNKYNGIETEVDPNMPPPWYYVNAMRNRQL
ncbi:F-box protein At3g07870-like isoform X2 [Papaver somniferum]|uniref:F-box protein At3g07870-like isoform X2 n=1 Tax=Papaver somniferum TaxID=3469 RepID=UPI000E6FC54F|nr:F-box protein At3g07870-like isoform X2 [Papaver somniferum]